MYPANKCRECGARFPSYGHKCDPERVRRHNIGVDNANTTAERLENEETAEAQDRRWLGSRLEEGFNMLDGKPPDGDGDEDE